MRSVALSIGAFLCVILSQSTPARSQPITLSYPLDRAENPYTATVTSVLDHSGSFNCGSFDRHVLAYTGELGGKRLGDMGNAFDLCDGDDLDPAPYGQNNKTLYSGDYPPREFVINGSEGSASLLLSYDGHRGYDFDCANDGSDKILAAADGDLVIVVPDSPYNTFDILHEGGWKTRYLHAKLQPDPRVGVKAGDPVADCWDFGVNNSDGSKSHLHFEVWRQVGGEPKIVDPYGWEWFESDPIDLNDGAEPQTEPLWDISRPIVTDVQKQPFNSFVIYGLGFEEGAVATLWDKAGRFAVCRFGVTLDSCDILPYAVTGTRIDVLLPVSNPANYVLKIMNPDGPRSLGWDLGSEPLFCPLSSQELSSQEPCLPPDPTSTAFFLKDEPAPGGGTFVSFASFYDSNNSGSVMFGAEIDLDGDNISDDNRTYEYLAGAFNWLEVLGIGKVGGVRINDVGDMAIADAGVPGRTQAIYFLRAGSSVPIKVVEWDQNSDVNNWTYYDPRGPLSMNASGQFTFQSALFDASINTVFCCYLFRYSPSTDTVLPILRDGDDSPVGGTFNTSGIGHNGLTPSGDVVFWSEVDGGAASAGIFRWSSSTHEYFKLVANGDPAPNSIGGTYIGVGFGPAAVAGEKLVFVSLVINGTVGNAIFVKQDVKMDSTADISVVAQPGQATGTSVGGNFSNGSPFSLNWPAIRKDGGVMFHSQLESATTDEGSPTNDGVFLWTGREFIKVAVEHDRLPNGQYISGVSSLIGNDLGRIYYFIAQLCQQPC